MEVLDPAHTLGEEHIFSCAQDRLGVEGLPRASPCVPSSTTQAGLPLSSASGAARLPLELQAAAVGRASSTPFAFSP